MRRDIETKLLSLIDSADNIELVIIVNDLYSFIRKSKLPNSNKLKYILRPNSLHLEMLLYLVVNGPTPGDGINILNDRKQPKRAYNMALDMLLKNGLVIAIGDHVEITQQGREILSIIGATIRKKQK